MDAPFSFLPRLRGRSRARPREQVEGAFSHLIRLASLAGSTTPVNGGGNYALVISA
jgi:hypothetical protein